MKKIISVSAKAKKYAFGDLVSDGGPHKSVVCSVSRDGTLATVDQRDFKTHGAAVFTAAVSGAKPRHIEFVFYKPDDVVPAGSVFK